ncbi:hypothetical protein KUTeg_007321 [Tegillarca granosa]|uniref:RING-type domain-containing protein n=1 Tax=Tegillarca granosa TaxID=220873 RepID=A0ABQ9FCY3_TEGGR|nr:hypothetical protein KUTeg_007321 [Tegillarca granosa]
MNTNEYLRNVIENYHENFYFHMQRYFGNNVNSKCSLSALRETDKVLDLESDKVLNVKQNSNESRDYESYIKTWIIFSVLIAILTKNASSFLSMTFNNEKEYNFTVIECTKVSVLNNIKCIKNNALEPKDNDNPTEAIERCTDITTENHKPSINSKCNQTLNCSNNSCTSECREESMIKESDSCIKSNTVVSVCPETDCVNMTKNIDKSIKSNECEFTNQNTKQVLIRPFLKNGSSGSPAININIKSYINQIDDNIKRIVAHHRQNRQKEKNILRKRRSRPDNSKKFFRGGLSHFDQQRTRSNKFQTISSVSKVNTTAYNLFKMDENFFDIKDNSFQQQSVEERTEEVGCSEILPRLAKNINKECEEGTNTTESICKMKLDKIKMTEKKFIRKPHTGEISVSYKKLSSLSMNKRKAWLLQKEIHSWFSSGFLTFPDYKSFSREWHRSSFPERRYHVYTLLTMQERLETFRVWPSDAVVSKIDLVEAGFVYKGEGYQVECDTCHLVKSDWLVDDVPLIIHKKLKPDCEFLKTTFPDLQVLISQNETDNANQVKGHQSLVNQMDSMSIRNHASQNELNLPTNVKNEETQRNMRPQNSFITAPQQQPLFDGAFTSMNPSTLFPPGATALPTNDGLSIAGVPPRHPDFATIQQRIWTFRPWPYGHIQDPVYLVDAGFYYIVDFCFILGKEDIVRCYFCDIGLAEWDAEDDPWAEHARHSPECEYLKREKGLEFIENIQVSWRQIYCPRHPEYSDYHVRVETYTNWPSHLDQRPNALAEAGFYYTGEDDVVRCHYCDGGLRQWEPGDVPWTEHARWFPFCKYIVKIKGLAFVEDIARRYNLLTQSQAVDPETQMIDDAFSEGERYSNLPDAVYDRILELGYTCQQINRAFHYHVQMTEQAAMKTPSDIENLEPEKLLDMNKQLRSQLICNICNKNESSIVFSPCGHRNTCENCSKDLSTCKTCGSRIDAKYKSYLA